MAGILTFIENAADRRILSGVLSECAGDRDCTGVLLEGSLARGDANPGSDIDLRVLLADGLQRPFRSEIIDGVRLEVRHADFERARARIETHSMDVYGYLDGRILHDPVGRLAELTAIARERYRSYRASPDERRRLGYWLNTAQEKVRSALGVGDTRKAALVAATSSWQMLEALWAINDKPMPPVGAVLAHRRDLTLVPTALTHYWTSFSSAASMNG